MFGRLGRWDDVQIKISEAVGAGGTYTKNENGTVVAMFGDDILFRALQKGEQNVWIIMYNEKYYPR